MHINISQWAVGTLPGTAIVLIALIIWKIESPSTEYTVGYLSICRIPLLLHQLRTRFSASFSPFRIRSTSQYVPNFQPTGLQSGRTAAQCAFFQPMNRRNRWGSLRLWPFKFSLGGVILWRGNVHHEGAGRPSAPARTLSDLATTPRPATWILNFAHFNMQMQKGRLLSSTT